MGRNRRGDDASGQLLIDWTAPKPAASKSAPSSLPASSLVQRLPWDFSTTFPQPTPEAIDAGVISDEDAEPENVRALHDEHARELLAVLHDLDAVSEARRRGVDPSNGKTPTTVAAKDRLQKLFANEPERLQRWWQTQMDVYESAFGSEAADAFGKAIRARHAGIDVIAEADENTRDVATRPEPPTVSSHRKSTNRPKRVVARLPVPRPLSSAVAAGHFGHDEGGKPIRPGADEVREITVAHADKLIDLVSDGPPNPGYVAALAAYAEDFGQPAAMQLEAYVRRLSDLGEHADLPSRRSR